jgi:hypothetical protein
MKNAKTVAKATKNDNANLSLEERWAKNAKKRATYPQVMGVVSHLNKVEDKPEGINWGNLNGHFMSKWNLKKGYLTQGQVTSIRNSSSFPVEVANDILAYKLENAIEGSK